MIADNNLNLKFNYEEGYVFTSDGVKIAYNSYKTGKNTVLIIAPGWFMSKDSHAFIQISNSFCKNYDVINFDFRGHCKSGGRYTFGRDEIWDLSAIVDFARKTYKNIYLMGFSLGALISLNYCASNNNIDKLIAVSAPTDFWKIENNVFSPNAFIPTLKKFEFKRWTSIRFKSPFYNKIKPIDVVDKIVSTPIYFIAGENDPIIKPWHNHLLFKKAIVPKKEILVFRGKHAEDIYLENKDFFVETCLKWLDCGE